MTVSPNDIRNYEFPTQMRGYAREEVDAFMDQVAASLEAARQENLKLSMELDSVRTQLSALKEFEDSIKNAAIDARRNADLTVTRAQEESEQMLSRAKAEAENMVAVQRQELADIDARIAKAEETKQSYLKKFRSLIEAHVQIIDDLSEKLPPPERPEIPKAGAQTEKHDDDTIVVEKSSEVSRDRMETVAGDSHEEEPVQTEEANAAGEIVAVSQQADAPEQPAADAAQAPADGEAGEKAESAAPDEGKDKEIDPELQAALKSYQTGTDIPIQPEDESGPEAESNTGKVEVAPLEGMVSTAQESHAGPAGTDRVPVSEAPPPEAAPQAPPEAAAKAPQAAAPKKNADGSDIDPDKLDEELDNVVAKFEEEMDKAARS